MLRLSRKTKIALSSALLLSLSVGLVAFSFYLLALDKQIRDRFAGARWALPAQVYAAPLELYPGLKLSAGVLRHELDRLGYRSVRQLSGPGTYADQGSLLLADVRAFHFWDGPQPELKLGIRVRDGTIEEIRDLEAGAPRQLVRLDPMLIGSIYPQHGEDRVLVQLARVPELLAKGLIAVEDRSFYTHVGVSPKAITRATLANLRAGHVVQGGSTITQQLVKNFFLNSKQTWARKLNEAFMAMLLEAHYDKGEILEAYLNEVHLGQDGSRAVHGFGLGSHFYFNKPLAELRAHEIALLIGIVKGPSYYNPRRNAERALERRNLVLSVLRDDGLLDEQAHREAVAQPLGVVGGKSGGVERYPAFVDLVRRQLKGQYQDSDLTNEGLRIFTTLDPRAQEVLERRVTEGLPQIEKARRMKDDTLEAAGVVTSVGGGDVLAMVGGRDVRYPGFNRALDARRSIGSLNKPFVYLTALMRPGQFNLHSILQDEPIELTMPHGAVWTPGNYDKELHGPQPLYAALAHSYNLPTVALGLQLGPAAVRDTMRAAGFTGDNTPLPSLFLGAVDVAPIEVAQMYGTLAAGGFQSPLTAIREVQTKDGEPLSRYPIKVKQTLPEGPVHLLNWALEQVMIFGTGRAAYNVIPPSVVLAGKTGTTDDYRDSWFAGFGADRVAVIWIGRDDNKPTGLSGSSGALPIWARIMRDLGARGLERIPPADVEEQLTDPATGLKADDGCVSAIMVPYVRGYAPQEYAPCAEADSPLDWLRRIFN